MLKIQMVIHKFSTCRIIRHRRKRFDSHDTALSFVLPIYFWEETE